MVAGVRFQDSEFEASRFSLLSEASQRKNVEAMTKQCRNRRRQDADDDVHSPDVHPSHATAFASIQRELQKTRKDMGTSAVIALVMAIAAIGLDFLSVTNAVMFLLGSWTAHGIAFQRIVTIPVEDQTK